MRWMDRGPLDEATPPVGREARLPARVPFPSGARSAQPAWMATAVVQVEGFPHTEAPPLPVGAGRAIAHSQRERERHRAVGDSLTHALRRHRVESQVSQRGVGGTGVR